MSTVSFMYPKSHRSASAKYRMRCNSVILFRSSSKKLTRKDGIIFLSKPLIRIGPRRRVSSRRRVEKIMDEKDAMTGPADASNKAQGAPIGATNTGAAGQT